MPHLYERWQLDRSSVLQSLRILLSDVIAEENSELKDKVDEIRTLIKEHENREPFSELPENISLQLDIIKGSKSDNTDELVNQLASSLTELYVSNNNELRTEKNYAWLGFIVGVADVTFSAYSLFASDADENIINEAKQEIVDVSNTKE